jgi:acyl carrier protein
MAEDIAGIVTQSVADTLRRDRGITDQPSPDMSLVDSGLLDSLSIVTFVGQLEIKFGITISMSDMTLDNFDNIRSITELVKAKRLSGEPGGDTPR